MKINCYQIGIKESKFREVLYTICALCKVFENPLWILLCYSSKLEEFDTLTLTRPLIIIKQRDDTKYYIQSTAFLILILPNQKFRLGIHFNLLSRFYLGTVCCFLKCYEICTYLGSIPITRVITISALP